MATDHKAEAEKWMSDCLGDVIFISDPAQCAAVLQAHATLYLAEQQRIANLIALSASGVRMVAEGTASAEDYLKMYDEINPIIREGLGLS